MKLITGEWFKFKFDAIYKRDLIVLIQVFFIFDFLSRTLTLNRSILYQSISSNHHHFTRRLLQYHHRRKLSFSDEDSFKQRWFNLVIGAYPKELQMLVECFNSSVLHHSLIASFAISMKSLTLDCSIALSNKDHDLIMFQMEKNARRISQRNNLLRFYVSFENPTPDHILSLLNEMGYNPPLTHISAFRKSNLPSMWCFFFGVFILCLNTRNYGLDMEKLQFYTLLASLNYHMKVDYTYLLWEEFTTYVKHSKKAIEIASDRFWSLALIEAYQQVGIQVKRERKLYFLISKFQKVCLMIQTNFMLLT